MTRHHSVTRVDEELKAIFKKEFSEHVQKPFYRWRCKFYYRYHRCLRRDRATRVRLCVFVREVGASTPERNMLNLMLSLFRWTIINRYTMLPLHWAVIKYGSVCMSIVCTVEDVPRGDTRRIRSLSSLRHDTAMISTHIVSLARCPLTFDIAQFTASFTCVL